MDNGMQHVLVVIPPNQTFSHMRIQTMSNDRYQKESRAAIAEPAHWFHGIKAIRDESQWSRYGYTKDRYGNPVHDPDKESLAKVQYDEYHRDRQSIDNAIDDPTVGDIKEQNITLQARLDALESLQQKSFDQIKGELRQEWEAEVADQSAVTKRKTASRK